MDLPEVILRTRREAQAMFPGIVLVYGGGRAKPSKCWTSCWAVFPTFIRGISLPKAVAGLRDGSSGVRQGVSGAA